MACRDDGVLQQRHGKIVEDSADCGRLTAESDVSFVLFPQTLLIIELSVSAVYLARCYLHI